MKTATFTSTISPQLLNWMKEYADQTNQTRRAILENALTQYKKEEIRQKMRADFKRAAADKETIDLSEWGMEDYNEMVTSLGSLNLSSHDRLD